MNQLDLFEEPEEFSFKNFTIYRSSAGSGKTFTLVKEYLKIVLRNPQDYQHILAITFTNKATEEMKDRILESLMKMASGESTDMQRVIEEEVKHYQQKLNIQDRAKKALTNILHNYSRFSVSTIDHFFSQMVRSLARELKINLNYEIDVDDHTAMKESLNLLYEQLGTDPVLRDWVKDFAFSQIEDDKGWQLDYTLVEFGKELFKEKFHKGFSKLEKDQVNISTLRDLEAELDIVLNRFRSDVRSYATQALQLIKQHGLSTEDFKGGQRGVANTFNKLVKNNFVLTATFQKVARGEGEWYTASSPKREEIKAIAAAGLDSIAQEILVYYESNYQEFISARELKRHIYSYGLLDALSEQLRTYRQTNNLMLLSHNSFLLKEIISDKEAPFLFEKLGTYYRHVLIDEFQDTSAYQWDILKPLLTNSLDDQNHVLLVGDVKQSIYRWRGGDLNLLLQKATSDLHNYRELLEEHTLNINRRSAQSVVDFNNRFFQYANRLLLNTTGLPDDSGMLTEVYREVEQEIDTKLSGGVSIQFFDNKQSDWRQAALAHSTRVIQEHITAEGRYSDVLILCYKNLEVAEISEHLSEHKIPVNSDKALSLTSHWAVRMMISAMYLLRDPKDQLARAELAYLYQRGTFGEEANFHQIFLESCDIRSGLIEEYLPEELISQWSRFASMNIYEWVSSVLPILVADDQPDPFLARFIEVCLEQNHKGRKTSKEFLDWWEENKQDQMVIFPDDQNAVTVMTIHKAKGLEAPIVILPWADFELKPRSDSLFWTDKLLGQYQKYKLLPLSFNKELLDSQFAIAYQQELLEGLTEGLNTVYVAFTRARQRLYVNSRIPSKSNRDELTTLYKLLWRICEQPEWDSNWDSQEFLLRIGDFTELVKVRSGEAKPAVPIDHLRVRSYHNKLKFQSAQHRMFTLLDNYQANSIREGIQVHAVLERIGGKQDIPKVMNQLVSEGLIRETQMDQLLLKIEQLFVLEEFQWFFDPQWQVFSEREIASEGRRYKPDRVLVGDNRTVVVDFKREKESDKHVRQIESYAMLLGNLGYQNIEKYLVYVIDAKVLRV